MADNSEKILKVEEIRSHLFTSSSLMLLHVGQGIFGITHCLRVVGRKPTISMAS